MGVKDELVWPTSTLTYVNVDIEDEHEYIGKGQLCIDMCDGMKEIPRNIIY